MCRFLSSYAINIKILSIFIDKKIDFTGTLEYYLSAIRITIILTGSGG